MLIHSPYTGFHWSVAHCWLAEGCWRSPALPKELFRTVARVQGESSPEAAALTSCPAVSSGEQPQAGSAGQAGQASEQPSSLAALDISFNDPSGAGKTEVEV